LKLQHDRSLADADSLDQVLDRIPTLDPTRPDLLPFEREMLRDTQSSSEPDGLFLLGRRHRSAAMGELSGDGCAHARGPHSQTVRASRLL